MDLVIGKLDILQDKLLDIERNQRTNENYRNSNLEAAESCSQANANDLRAKLEEMERSTMARQNDLERRLDKMEREMMASKIVYLQDKLQDIEQKLKNSESLREGNVKTAELSTNSNEENLRKKLNEIEQRMMAKEAFLQSKLEDMELANKARDEKLRFLDEKLQDIEPNLKTSISYSTSEASTKTVEDNLCNKLDDMEVCITADEDVAQSNLDEVLLKTAEVETHMTAKEDPLKEAVQLIKETENKLTKQLKNMDEELDNLRDDLSKVTDLRKVVSSLISSSKCCMGTAMKQGGKHRLALHFNQPALVYCDHINFGAGWIVFQHRYNGEVDFYRGWADYQEGFGDFDGEFWLGLEHLHKLTCDENYQLLVEMKDHAGKYTYAKYDNFAIRGETDEYRLEIGSYSGTAEDSMQYNNGYGFLAKDGVSGYNGYNPINRHGAWWGSFTTHCANLNGSYQHPSDSFKGMSWHYNDIRGKAFTRMMIRKASSKN